MNNTYLTDFEGQALADLGRYMVVRERNALWLPTRESPPLNTKQENIFYLLKYYKIVGTPGLQPT